MFQAAIVEDEASIRSSLQRALSEQFTAQNISVSFDEYADGDSFLHSFSEGYHYDMLFLDIEMPGTDGIAAAKCVRERNEQILIVFISSRESLVFDTFTVQPFRFIRKSRLSESLPELVNALVLRLRKSKDHKIFLTEPGTGDLYSFDPDKLLYVEAQRKDCRFVTVSGETLIRCPFGYAERVLEASAFIKAHRSYLVNPAAIFYVGKTELTLTDRSTIPISRDRVNEVKEQFMAYIVAKEGM
ncbi:MAG: LytTR family DNA-binding domain-containing protein [Clostridia bacterium]|nr:LytTR family DNA-binding domain-containing protein [Clostridia bacterium]